MDCAKDEVTIQPGRNLWVFARTDRDAASKDTVLKTTGAVLKRFLGRNSPPGTRSIFETMRSPKDSGHDARFVIGAARPVLVDAFQASSPAAAVKEMPTIPRDVRTDRFEQCPVLRTVQAQRPWFVVVEFDWRGKRISIPWPRRAVGALGIPFDTQNENDWLLLAAGFRGPPEEDEADVLDELTDDTVDQILEGAEKAAKTVAPIALTLGLIAGGGLLVYFLAKTGRRQENFES